MITNKTMNFLQAAIAQHDLALAKARARAAEADERLNTFKAREIEAYKKTMRPGQMGVYLQPSAEREELERLAKAANAEVMRLETNRNHYQNQLDKLTIETK